MTPRNSCATGSEKFSRGGETPNRDTGQRRRHYSSWRNKGESADRWQSDSGDWTEPTHNRTDSWREEHHGWTSFPQRFQDRGYNGSSWRDRRDPQPKRQKLWYQSSGSSKYRHESKRELGQQYAEDRNFSPLQRPWKSMVSDSESPGDNARGAFTFIAMTYNLLAQSLLLESIDSLYRQMQPWMSEWSNRKRGLLTEIEMYDPDVMTLQEIDEEHWHSDIEPHLRGLGYRGYYQKRTGTARSDGVAILVREAKFEIVASRTVCHKQNSFMDRDNVGMVVLLRSKEAPDQHVCTATTHLLYNGRRSFIKMAQFKWLADNAADLVKQHLSSTRHRDVPFLISGDFNSTPNSVVARFVRSGYANLTGGLEMYMSGQFRGDVWTRWNKEPSQVEPLGSETSHFNSSSDGALSTPPNPPEPLSRAPQTISHPLRLQCVYHQHHLGPHGDYVTTYHHGTREAVDYLLVGSFKPLPSESDFAEVPRTLIKAIEYVPPPVARSIRMMPNANAASDHIPLVAKFGVFVTEPR
ncbi:hypothetical protein M427DRAFT_167718 [Gonapodya prolifera JEL478]|uniref:Endonuclease/exonuclease/phosphatase domain-containing protein n=1 Tax=Gonapodya prolifera (strain JEL478) TaxID=1344416 RepID=A0A139B0L1_GONPJ|nr:hypothetical protein M427DRAFT_167718 [Gonapodya prolifera JEL478]|eukprot:KXS22235.1 hypothetical protein M427DRAFT_167718 [Gonapodya prolifera JEL478]